MAQGVPGAPQSGHTYSISLPSVPQQIMEYLLDKE